MTALASNAMSDEGSNFAAAVGDGERVRSTNDRASAPGHGPAFHASAALPASVSVWCVQAFAPAALAGAVIALTAPVTFVRVLGLVALVAGIAGAVLHAALLRRDHPAAWDRWFATHRARFARLRTRWNPRSSSAPGTSGAHGLARFAPVMAQEN